MKKFNLKIRQKRFLADTITPVSLYLKVRDKYANSFLLESSDYHGAENSFSYICCAPMASFKLFQNKISTDFPDGSSEQKDLSSNDQLLQNFREFLGCFAMPENEDKFIKTGLFGYMAYDAVQYFEDIKIENKKTPSSDIPEIQYHLFKFIIALDHFRNECFIIECFTEEKDDDHFEELQNLITQRNIPSFGFAKKWRYPIKS